MTSLLFPPLLRRLILNYNLRPFFQFPTIPTSLTFSLPAPLTLPTFSTIIPYLKSLLDDLTLYAVPKKRSSYSKKRSRQLAGKALKDVTGLVHCSACGRVKRRHVLCPYCVQNIKDMWAHYKRKAAKTEARRQLRLAQQPKGEETGNSPWS